MGKLTFVLGAIICLFWPCEASADVTQHPLSIDSDSSEPFLSDRNFNTSARAPRMGLEVGTLVGHSWWWHEGYESGWQIQTSLGFGVIEEHGGAMLRYAFGGTDSNLFGDKRLEDTHNLSALVWMPFAAGRRLDAYLAAGPLLQWAGSDSNSQVFTGVVAETGVDLLTELRFLRLRYALRTQLTSAGADVLLTIASSFWSWPL